MWRNPHILLAFLLIYLSLHGFEAKNTTNNHDSEVEPQSNTSTDYDFEDVLSRHKRQCACLSQYTPVNCKCQQADPSNSNDLSCRCDRAVVSPQCSCAPAASTLCFPVCQQQCIQSCVAQQQSVPQCQPPCQLICQRACQSLPAAPVYATLQPLQIGGQPAPQAPLTPLPVESNGRVIYAIPQAPAPLPHAPSPPAPNAQSIGQATVYLPTQAQCLPLCTEQCMKNCPNSPGQCAQTCTNGCQAACSRQPMQVNQPGPPMPLPSPQNDHGCVALCRPDCSPKCVRQFVEPSPASSSLVLAQVGNRDTASNKHRAPPEYVLQESNDFGLPSNTRTIFEQEYFIPLDGRSNNIVIPIPLPNQPQLEINLSQGPGGIYATAPTKKEESSSNQTKMYEVPTQTTSTTTEQPTEQSTPPSDSQTSNNDNRLRAAMTASGLSPLQIPGYSPYQQNGIQGLQPFQNVQQNTIQSPQPFQNIQQNSQPYQVPQQPSYTPAQIAAYYQQLLTQLGGLQSYLNYQIGGQQTGFGQPNLNNIQNTGQNADHSQSPGLNSEVFQQQIMANIQEQNPKTQTPSNLQSAAHNSGNLLSSNYLPERVTPSTANLQQNQLQNLPSLLQSDQQTPTSNYPPKQHQQNWLSNVPPQKQESEKKENQQATQNSQQQSQRMAPQQPNLLQPPSVPTSASDKISAPSVLLPSQPSAPPGFQLSNSYLPQAQSQLFASPYMNGQIQAYLPPQKTSLPTRQYSPRRPDTVPTKLYSPPSSQLNDAAPGELRLDIQWPGQTTTDPNNCTGPGVQCVQQYNKGFRVTASEAQSFFKRRFSKIKASASVKRKDSMMEFDEQTKANRAEPKAIDYLAMKNRDAVMENPRQRRPIGGSGRVQRTDREECQDSCRKVCSRACEKHRLSSNDYKCTRSCVDECSQRCPAFKHM